MGNRRLLGTAEYLQRFWGNLIAARTLQLEYLPPLLAVYHVTYGCNAHCAWCSRKQDRREAALDVSWTHVERIFRSLRQVSPALYLSGGGPLLEPRIEEMIALARDIGFYPIAVNTNATLLDQRSRVPELADLTVVSLHSADPFSLARSYGLPESTMAVALRSIIQSNELARAAGNRLIANCVLAPDTVEDATGVLDLCLKLGIPLTVVPAIVDQEPLIKKDDMAKRPVYTAHLDRMMLIKRLEPGAVGSSLRYLHCIRDLQQFACRPTSILSVSPDGHILNPCEIKYPHLPRQLARIDDDSGPLLDLLPKLLDGERRFSSCPKHCLKACYVEPALALEQPVQAISEHFATLVLS